MGQVVLPFPGAEALAPSSPVFSIGTTAPSLVISGLFSALGLPPSDAGSMLSWDMEGCVFTQPRSQSPGGWLLGVKGNTQAQAISLQSNPSSQQHSTWPGPRSPSMAVLAWSRV